MKTEILLKFLLVAWEKKCKELVETLLACDYVVN